MAALYQLCREAPLDHGPAVETRELFALDTKADEIAVLVGEFMRTQK